MTRLDWSGGGDGEPCNPIGGPRVQSLFMRFDINVYVTETSNGFTPKGLGHVYLS